MNPQQIATELAKKFDLPAHDQTEWLADAKCAVDYIGKIARSEYMIIWASVMPFFLMHGMLAPTEKVSPPDFDDLSHLQVFTDDSWMIEHSSGGGMDDRVYLDPSLKAWPTRSIAICNVPPAAQTR